MSSRLTGQRAARTPRSGPRIDPAPADVASVQADADWQRLLTESLPNILWAASVDGANQFCNPQWTAYTGLSRAQSLGDGWLQALHPDDRDMALAWWKACCAAGMDSQIRYRLRRTDGSPRWHLINARPILDPRGRVTQWIGSAIDIHDQVEAESRERATDEKYRNLVELSDDAIYIRVEGRIVFANAATARLHGVASPQALLGRAPLDFVHPGDQELVRSRWSLLQRLHKALPPIEIRLVRADGTVIEVESTASPIEYEGRPAAHVVLRDISERKALQRQQVNLVYEQAAHAQAAAQAEHFRLLAEAVPNMVWTATADGGIDYGNRRVFDYMGCTPDDIRGWAWARYVHPDDLPVSQSRWRRSLATGEAFEVEQRILRADGTYRWHITRALAVREEGGRIGTWVGTCMDIDDQKQAQALLASSRASLESAVRARTAELLQANAALRTEIAERWQAEAALRASEDKLRKLSAHLQSAREAERAAMAREIHDELGASLTAVKMDLARHAKTAGSLPAASRRLLEGIGTLVDGAIQVVRRIATQLRPSILDHLGLWPALEWQIGEFEHRYGVACSIAFQAPPPDLDKEAQTALFRIVQEALTNIARHAGASRVQVTVGARDGRLLIDISDNGIGMPQARIADPASCGLQGMQERALALGGMIRFDSSPHHGTRLTVSLPLAASAQSPADLETA